MWRYEFLQRAVGAPPAPTGSDKTSIVAELPDDKAGRLLEMLEQFATSGVNMSLLASRPIGDALGRYRFVGYGPVCAGHRRADHRRTTVR